MGMKEVEDGWNDLEGRERPLSMRMGCLPCSHSLNYPPSLLFFHLSFCLSVHPSIQPFFPKILFIYLFILERGEGQEKERERERNINVWLPLTRPLLGTWPATQAPALTGN